MASKAAASVPLRVMVLVPRASSLIEISATLIAVAVSVFSAILLVGLVSATTVGASLTSLIATAYS